MFISVALSLLFIALFTCVFLPAALCNSAVVGEHQLQWELRTEKLAMLCLLSIEADGLPKVQTTLCGFSEIRRQKKIILKSESIKCKDQIVMNTRNNLQIFPPLDMLKIVFMVVQFSLLEKGNKNTLYFLKLMCSMWAYLSSCLLYTRFLFFHLLGSCFSSVCYLSIPFLKSDVEISFLGARPSRILQYFAFCWTDYYQSTI